MTKSTHKTSVSLLLGSVVRDAQGADLGSLQEFGVSPDHDPGHVSTLVLRPAGAPRGAPLLAVEVNQLCMNESCELRLREGGQTSTLNSGKDLLLLERDLLDQQIIDVHGHKVVRVNDVNLVWEHALDEDGLIVLRIHEVEIGLRGAIRRLLKGLPAASIEKVATRFRSSVIPWDFVDLIERDPARRVRLKIEQDRLSKMHPSDIADILEELAPSERRALFNSLDEEVAAEALEEVNTKTKQALIEALDSETIAGIVEEMDPGAAADLLSELPQERSDAILEEMDPEERRDVEDLLEFAGDSAAGLMTTDYISLRSDATVEDAKNLLRAFDGDVELVSDIYLMDAEQRISSVVPIVQILLAEPEATLETLPQSHLFTCGPDTPGRKVAEIFDKYNLRSLPVVDAQKHLAGVVHAEQIIATLRAKH